MRAIRITETDIGQWVVETSSGVRSAGASLESALAKALPVTAEPVAVEIEVLRTIFAGIHPTSTGQIRSGQAGV